MNEELLAAALIPEELWSVCFVDNEGTIYPPYFNQNNVMLMDGSEAKAWIAEQDEIEAPPTQMLEQRLIEQGQILTDLDLESIENGQRMTDLELMVLEVSKNV